MQLTILEVLIIFALGILVGWTLGTIRTHAPLINHFRDYYHRQAEARVRQHTGFVLSQMQSFGAALKSHRSAANASVEGGRRRLRPFLPRDYRAAVRTGKEDTPISSRLENS
jgi:hypothetical protein